MLSFVKQHRLALLWSVVLHGSLLAILGVSFFRDNPFAGAPAPQSAIEATVVDAERVEEEMRKLDEADQKAAREREAEQKRLREQADQARREQEEETRRLEALREKREAAVAEQQQREAEQKKQAAEREAQAKLDAERAAQAKRDKESAAKREEEIKKQQEAERERLAELERKRKEEEARLARIEDERRAAEEARRKEAAEAAMRSEIETEQQLAALRQSPEADRYRALLQQHIQRQWIKPPSAQQGIECEVQVTQIPSGDVTNVQVGACNGDAAVIRSIEAAVHRASPLPRPPDPDLFERNLTLVFKPDS